MLDNIKVSELVKYNQEIKNLDKEQEEISLEKNFSDSKKSILLTSIFVKKAKVTYSCFGDIPFDNDEIEKSTQLNPKKDCVDFLILWYNNFLKEFEDFKVEDDFDFEELGLQKPELTNVTDISFGQFVDAKMITEGGQRNGHDKWEVLQYIMAIFLLPKNVDYDEVFTFEESEQFIRCTNLNLKSALIVSIWWDKLNNYINSKFTLFQENGEVKDGSSNNVDEHMKKWGWINFLKSLAKTKAFDISGSGKNSIDCVRQTKCATILSWASEEKEYNFALGEDFKSNNRS